MKGAEWARLSQPFPPEAIGWNVVALSEERDQVRLAPYLRSAAVRARLDEVAGPSGWSFQLAPLGSSALVCNLTVLDVGRAALAQAPSGPGAPPADLAVLAESALSASAELFGLPLPAPADDGWVDYDAEEGEALYTPQLLDRPAAATAPSHPGAAARERGAPRAAVPLAAEAPGAGPSDSEAPAGAAPAEAAEAAGEAGAEPLDERSHAHQVIDRLLERLKAEGLGKEAARLVVAHGGYGRTPEEARELYGKLRSLLIEKKSVAP